MSQLIDFVFKQEADNMDLDINSFLPEDIKNMDIPLSLDNGDLMSSDFFDSVLSMEKQNSMDLEVCNMQTESNFSYNLSPTYNGMSEHSSLSSDSEHFLSEPSSNITLFGKGSSETFTGNDFFSLMEPHNIQTNINNILEIAGTQQNKRARQISNPKKVIVSKPVVTQGVKKGLQPGKKQQVIRVQAINGNGRSLLLPVNVKSVKKLKIINPKEIDADSIKMFSNAKNITKKTPSYAASVGSESEFEVDTENYTSERSYPPLQLSGEEKRLLMKEGIKLPTHYPLTKSEEKELKRIRRKIRNKISAQDSRKRKKEYVDQLEEKARRTDEENEILKKRVKLLNKENTRLYEQLKKLQDLLFNSSNKATPATCLMIVLFSTLLVFLPSLRTANNKDLEVGEQLTTARRALLFNKPSKEDDELDEFLIFKDDVEINFEDEEKDNGTNAFVKYLGDLSEKYESLIRSNCTEILQGGSLQEFCKKHEDDFKVALQNLRAIMAAKEEKKFIEPDISDDEDSGGQHTPPVLKHHNAYLLDDDDPPTKKGKISSDDLEDYDRDSLFHQKPVEIVGETNLFNMKKE